MSRATTLWLVRHGDVAGQGRLYGQVDVPLSPEGEARMAALARRLAGEPLSALYASDLSRARKSAEILAEGRGLSPVCLPEFRELHMGRWDGLAVGEVYESEPELLAAWWADVERFRVPGGESMAELSARALPALRALVTRHPGEALCLVAHGGVTRAILFDALGLPLSRFYAVSQDYGCLNRIRYFEDGKTVVDLVNA